MKLSSLLLALAATLILPVSFCAPANFSATLHKSALDAQILNAEFEQLVPTRPCDSNQLACIENSIATCTFGQWNLTTCSAGTQCYALPADNGNISINCTDSNTAQTIFKNAGVLGGPIHPDSRTVPFPTRPPMPPSSQAISLSSTPLAYSSSPTPTPTPTYTSDDEGVVTVTVTVAPLSFFTTLPVQITTILPASARSLIASLVMQGGNIVVPTATA